MKTKNKKPANGITFTEPATPLDTNHCALAHDQPTPLDFDEFIPWVCLQWGVPEVVKVTRMTQEVYVSIEQRKPSSSRSKSIKSIKLKRDELDSDTRNTTNTAVPTSTSDEESGVSIRAYYDSRGYLVEVAIIDCPFIIHRKVIHAINICIPFHSLLTNFKIRRGGLSHALLYEIAKLLPHTNITEVCLDDSPVPEGNYFVILEQTSQLKYLSLNRCCINDSACQEIARRISFGKPNHSSLAILELSTNSISDVGAKSLGEMLRTNRRLLHLNLSGNNITDIGAKSILIHLMKFQLKLEEVEKTRHRRLKYIQEKAIAYDKCMEEVIRRQRSETLSSIQSARKSIHSTSRHNKSPKKSRKTITSIVIEEQSAAELAELMTKEMVGEFEDPFDNQNIVEIGGYSFSIGNMILCSLNLAYNNLAFESVEIIQNVLNYQSQIVKPVCATGLLKVIIVGNFVPRSCFDYENILIYLKKAVNDNLALPVLTKKRTSITKKLL